MNPGINQWAFPSDMTAAQAISMAADLGFTSFEVCVGEDGPVRLDSAEPELIEIRNHAEQSGVLLHSIGCGLGWSRRLSAADPSERDHAVSVHERSLEIAHTLGAKTLLVVPGVVDADSSYETTLEHSRESIRRLIPTAERLGVSLALENVWNKFLLSPTEMRDYIDSFGSEAVGAYFDVGNIVLYGFPEQWLRILDQRVHAVHMKDFRAAVGNFGGFVMLMEGDVNWPAVMDALHAIGYKGPLTAEYGAYPHSLETMLQHVHSSLTTIIALGGKA